MEHHGNFLVAVLLEVLPRSGFSRVLATQGDNIKCFCTKLGVGREGGKFFQAEYMSGIGYDLPFP